MSESTGLVESIGAWCDKHSVHFNAAVELEEILSKKIAETEQLQAKNDKLEAQMHEQLQWKPKGP